MGEKENNEARRLGLEFREYIDKRFTSTEKWLSDVEAQVNTHRSHGPSGAHCANGLPERHRHLAEMYERQGAADPVGRALLESYAKSMFQLAFESVRPSGRQAEYLRDLERVQVQGWGLQAGAVHKSLSEGTNTQGGFTVATPVEAELYRLIRDNTVVRPLATKIVMGGPTVQLPGEASNITAYLIPESVTITESTTTTASQFAQTPLVAKKFGGFATVSNELLQDNIIGLQDYLFTAIAEHIGVLEDAYALDGSTGNFTGLDLASGINSFTTSNTSSGGDAPTFNELITCIYTAKQRASRQNGRFVMHPTAFKNIAGMVDTTGQPVIMFNNAANAIPYFVGGFPVELTSALSLTKTTKTSSTNIYFGPMNKIIFGDIAGMQFDIDPFSLFQKVLTNVRVIKRTGIAVPVPSAFTVIHGVKNS